MDRKGKVEQEVEKTLQCFDQIEKIESNPFFYTRVQTRTRGVNAERKEAKVKLFSMGVLRPAFLILFVALNIISTVLVFQKKDYQTGNKEEFITSFAKEYSLNQDNYNLFTMKK